MTTENNSSAWVLAMPATFVLLWSTGFIGAKLGLPYAEPFTFLFLRFAILTVLLILIALAFRAPWPKTWAEMTTLSVVGLLVHGAYLGGVFAAISVGVPAGITAVIVGLQPLLTALGAGLFLDETITKRQWLGFALGLVGVLLVLGDKLSLDMENIYGIMYAVIALLGITVGTLYQKSHGHAMDLRSGSAIQFAVAAIPMGLLAWFFESRDVHWTGEFVFALGWLVIVLSLGAMTLLFLLIRSGGAAKIASLFYLVPPVTAIFAWALFGESLGLMALGGMGIVVIGVALVTKG
ncbi:MAG: EamA family transporter [Rhodospirillaceae bacterium]|nr:MAG: EamA family transporter [Rhodospirillaceae bacterium]